MHIPDGFINVSTSAGFGAAAASGIWYSLRRAGEYLDDRRIPLAGLVAAFEDAARERIPDTVIAPIEASDFDVVRVEVKIEGFEARETDPGMGAAAAIKVESSRPSPSGERI